MRSPRAAIGLLAALVAVSLAVSLAGCGGPSGSAASTGTAGSSSGLTSDAALPTQVPTGTTLVIADQAEYQLLDQPRAQRDPAFLTHRETFLAALGVGQRTEREAVS
jgi:hypothetical protein